MAKGQGIICVTGGAGYIGSHVVRQLTERGEKVIVIDNLSTGFADALIGGEKLYQGDIRNAAFLEKVFTENKIETVMHFAAAMLVEESMHDPLKYYDNNVHGTSNVLAACVKSRVKNFVLSSTAATYGMPASGICSEEDPLAPINPYGASKAMCEGILSDVSMAHALRYVALRYFNVAGADPELRVGQRTKAATHLVKVCVQAALGTRKAVEIFGADYATPDGTCVRDYIHVEDLASAHLAALDYLYGVGPSVTCNVGYGRGASVREVIEMTRKVTGVNFKSVNAARRAGDPPSLIASANKIRSVLEWKPKYDSLEKIITDAYRWEKTLGG